MGWISTIKEYISERNNSFFGYSSKDIIDIMLLVRSAKEKNLRTCSMDLRLEPYLVEVSNCLHEKNYALLNLHKIEIKRLLDLSVHQISFEPLISNTIHVPSWVVVLFVPFDKLPLYINIPSDLYRSLVAWRLKRGK